MTDAGPLTAEQYAALPELPNRDDELWRGQVVTFDLPTFRHGECCAVLAALLGEAARNGDWGRATLRCGIVVGRNPDSVFGPYLAFWSRKRMPAAVTGYPEIPPELAIEVLDGPRDVHAGMYKVPLYLAFGVDQVWLVDTETRSVQLHRRSDHPAVVDEGEWRSRGWTRMLHRGGDDVLECGEWLPNFRCEVSDVFG